MCRAHDGQGTVMFLSATIRRGVHSMVIACVPGSKYETWMNELVSWEHSEVPRPSSCIGLMKEYETIVG